MKTLIFALLLAQQGVLTLSPPLLSQIEVRGDTIWFFPQDTRPVEAWGRVLTPVAFTSSWVRRAGFVGKAKPRFNTDYWSTVARSDTFAFDQRWAIART